MARYLCGFCAFLRTRIYLITWISLVIYLFYKSFTFYLNGRQFYYLRRMLGFGLCISRGTATILNLCCALVLLPLCKKLNQLLYRVMSKLCPGLFFLWLEKAKSFHMSVAITLLIFGVVHSISHFVNLYNFSRGYDEQRSEINLARYRNESPLSLLMSVAGVTGVSMLVIILSMGVTSSRAVRRRVYNAFWYTHQLYLPFMVLLMIHPLSGVLKEEILDEGTNDIYKTNYTTIILLRETPKFAAIKSVTWLWMIFPLSCFLIDMLWRIFTRNLSRVQIINVNHMAGHTISLTLFPQEPLQCRSGQYVLLQCHDISLVEWHPFTVVQVPTKHQREFVVWIKVKGDWTEALERILKEKGSHNINVCVDGPFPSPLQRASQDGVSLLVSAGVGVTPFVSLLHDMYLNPRSKLPGRIHLIWIVRTERELTWIAELANNIILKLRNANRPDRLHLELYVTSSNNIPKKSHMVIINENGNVSNVLDKSDEKATLLTPHMKRNGCVNTKLMINDNDNDFDISKKYPLIGCRVRRGRPHWDKVFGYWVHLYPGHHLSLYCCGPKKLVKLLRNKCTYQNRNDLIMMMANLDKTLVAYNFFSKTFFFLTKRNKLKILINEIKKSGDAVSEDRKKLMAIHVLVITFISTALVSTFSLLSQYKFEMAVEAWMPFDPLKDRQSLLLSMQILAICFIPCMYRAFALQGIVCSIIMYFCDQLIELQQRLKAMSNAEESERQVREEFKSIVKKHVRLMRYSKTFTNIFKEFFLIQNLAVTIELCFNALMVTVVGLKEKTLLASFLTFLGLALFNAYIFCFLGDELIVQSTGIAQAAYESGWTSWPLDMQKDTLIVIRVAQRPLMLSAGGMAVMCIQTYSEALYNAYSIFAVLNDVVD